MNGARVHSSDGFKDDIGSHQTLDRVARYWRYGGRECGYVPSLLKHPSYEDLRTKRLEYYFYWRSKVFEGDCLDTDAGYVWLHCLELVTVNDDPKENMRCLLGMREAYRDQDPAVDGLIASCCGYYAIVNGLVRYDFGTLTPAVRCARICQVLSDPKPIPLSSRDVAMLVPSRGRRNADVLKRTGAVASAVLHELGRRSNGILEICPRQTEMALSFPMAADLGMPGTYFVKIRYHDIKGSDSFMSLASEVCSECMAVLSGKKPRAGGRFAPTIDACIALHAAGRLDSIEPYAKKGAPVLSSRTFFGKPGEPYRQSAKDGCWPSYRFAERARTFGEMTAPPTIAGRGSTSDNPRYSAMTLDEFAGYQAWKETVLRGEKAEGDDGFAWLLTNELLNDPAMDPEAVLMAMELCSETPGRKTAGMCGEAISCWCLLHGLRSDRVSKDCRGEILDALTLRALRSDPPEPLCPERIDRASVMSADRVLTDAVNGAITAIYESNGRSLTGAVSLSAKKMTVPVFVGMAGMPMEIETEVPGDPADVNRFVASVCKIAEAVVSKDPNPRTPAGFGKSNRDAAVRGAIGSMMAAKRRSMAGVELDMDAVRAAEEDLSAVTDMMRIEDDEPEEELDTGTQSISTGDPWLDLAARLDDAALGYLERCLEGTPFDAMAERAVNEAAMETVGDAVVEDGTVVEDYEEDARRMLSAKRGGISR